ncbi:MAG TPA: hypothetical protein VKP30_21220, partial [Polyangiaceae bacterium]|nr:hypothetical protein [Polyangiaceae bacterium]
VRASLLCPVDDEQHPLYRDVAGGLAIATRPAIQCDRCIKHHRKDLPMNHAIRLSRLASLALTTPLAGCSSAAEESPEADTREQVAVESSDLTQKQLVITFQQLWPFSSNIYDYDVYSDSFYVSADMELSVGFRCTSVDNGKGMVWLEGPTHFGFDQMYPCDGQIYRTSAGRVKAGYYQLHWWGHANSISQVAWRWK